MERFCQGEVAAFEALFARHAGPVRGYLSRLVRRTSVADELTQATFLSLVRAKGRFRAGARFKPWLYAIATNAARDHLRRHKFEAAPQDNLAEQSVDAIERDEGLERAVTQALATLPPAQREAIVMNRYHGLSFAEIAQAEGVTESAVKVRAHRGYERLRELLRGVWEDAL